MSQTYSKRASASRKPLRVAPRPNIGIVTRTILVVALSFSLLIAIRWAMNVTQSNTRQVSSNLRKIQGKMSESKPARERHTKSRRAQTPLGPTIEPEGQ